MTAAGSTVFGTLREFRAFEKRHMGFLRTIEEHDLVLEIGYHQATRAPLMLKQLFLLDIGSVATIRRRMRRLRHLGAVLQKRSEADRRAVKITLSPKLLKIFARYGELLTSGRS